MENYQEDSNSYQMSNEQYVSPSIIQIRLDTQKVIESIETYLKGRQMQEFYDENGNKVFQEIQVAEPKANNTGIYNIMGFIKGKVNEQVVQGFFAADGKGHSDMFNKYMDDVHLSLTIEILTNCSNWDIEDKSLSGIIDNIMHLTRAFMTRLIGNKERESYSQTFKTTENNTMKEQGGFSLFKNHKR